MTKPKKAFTGTVPFDKDGNQQHYEMDSYVGKWGTPEFQRIPPTHVTNFEFTDTLRYESCERGRSAMTWKFRRAHTGTTVTFMLGDFEDLIPFMIRGEVTGTFTFVKKGANYGCVRVEV